MSQKRPVRPDDAFRLKFIQDGRFAPDGSTLVYAVSHTDDAREKDLSTLWLKYLDDSGQTRQLTAGTHVDHSPRWSPDGRQIAFISVRGEGDKAKPQIYLIHPDGGEAKQLTAIKQGVGGGPEWSPDGQYIAFTAGPDREPRDPHKPYRLDRHPYRFDNMGYLDDVMQDIYVIHVGTGEVKRLTHDRAMNSSPQWSPDGQLILYTTMLPAEISRWKPGLRVVDLDGQVRDVVWDWGMSGAGAWLPDSRRVAFIGEPFGKLPGSKNDLWIIDLQNGQEPECRTAGLRFGVGGGLQGDMPTASFYMPGLYITQDGKTAYAPVHAGGTLGIYRVALEGAENWEPVITGERTCKLLDVDRAEQRLLYNVSTMFNPTDLFTADIEGGGEQQITAINADVLNEFEQPAVENLRYTSFDSVEVEAWIMKPPAGKGRAPYSTILYTHGGPQGAWGHIYSFDFHMLAGAGYAVLFVNYRGSTGYGDEFTTAITQNWGTPDYHDHMAGVDYAVSKGIADPQRLGVCGLSAGGYATCMIVGKTRRFKAAVPENPVTNLVTLYGVSDIGVLIEEMMCGKPHEQPEAYRRCSPISYAHTCTTPTLIIQGEADYRCPAEQAEQFYSVLKANGCIVEMLRIPGAPHAASINGPPPIRKAQNEALLEWMNRYVTGSGSGGA